jgi:hypothetical protein
MQLSTLRPAVDKRWLIILSGLMWSGVGVMLSKLAVGWLSRETLQSAIWLGLLGMVMGLTIYRFGFSKLADENIHRVDDYEDNKICVFAFQKWTSYPLVAVMIAMGIFLRNFDPLPKSWLAPLYLGIGSSLFFASIHYYIRLAKMHAEKS